MNQIGSNWIKLEQIGTDWIIMAEIGSNLNEYVQTALNWIKMD